MMKKLLVLIAATLVSLTSAQVYAAPVDEGPPVQHQKDQLPDTNKTGDYLETQPGDSSDVQQSGDKHNKKQLKDSKNKSKDKKMPEPKDGGTEVNQ